MSMYFLKNRGGSQRKVVDAEKAVLKMISQDTVMQNFIFIPFRYFRFVRVIIFITISKYA